MSPSSAARKDLRRRLILSQFRPGLFGLLTNPFYFARANLHTNLSKVAARAHGRLLDVGCGQKPYRDLFSVTEYVGLEYDTPENRANKAADFFYDGRSFPFVDASFDTVLASQVFEHVFNPDQFLGEARRVLRPGGTLLLTLPFVWDEHEQPHDFARYSSFGMRHLLQQHGFEVGEVHKSGADFSVLLQTWGMYAYKALSPGKGMLKLAAARPAHHPAQLGGQPAGADHAPQSGSLSRSGRVGHEARLSPITPRARAAECSRTTG